MAGPKAPPKAKPVYDAFIVFDRDPEPQLNYIQILTKKDTGLDKESLSALRFDRQSRVRPVTLKNYEGGHKYNFLAKVQDSKSCSRQSFSSYTCPSMTFSAADGHERRAALRAMNDFIYEDDTNRHITTRAVMTKVVDAFPSHLRHGVTFNERAEETKTTTQGRRNPFSQFAFSESDGASKHSSAESDSQRSSQRSTSAATTPDNRNEGVTPRRKVHDICFLCFLTSTYSRFSLHLSEVTERKIAFSFHSGNI